jgi:3D (Asp-Asp-Asp) domain-containing protein
MFAVADVPSHAHYPRTALVTSYCLLGRMRNGAYVHPHAAASVSLPLGTRLKFARRVVNGVRRVRIEDTGRLVPGQVDVWSPSCDLARTWGVRRVNYRLGW